MLNPYKIYTNTQNTIYEDINLDQVYDDLMIERIYYNEINNDINQSDNINNNLEKLQKFTNHIE